MTTELPELPDKAFFSMGEACRIVSLPAHTLRYWEARVGSPKPARRSSGHRRYSRSDLEAALRVKELIQRRRMTLAGARKALLGARRQSAPVEAGKDLPGETRKVLREVRQELKELLRDLAK